MQDFISKALPKSSHSSRPVARLEFRKSSSSRSPSPNRKQVQDIDGRHLTDEQLFSGGQSCSITFPSHLAVITFVLVIPWMV